LLITRQALFPRKAAYTLTPVVSPARHDSLDVKLIYELITSLKCAFHYRMRLKYEGWNFNSGNYLFTTDTK